MYFDIFTFIIRGEVTSFRCDFMAYVRE